MFLLRTFILCAFLTVLLLPYAAARAECTLKSSGETRPAGTVIFNKDKGVLQGCKADGRWIAISPFKPPVTCENGPPGTLCDDGSFYIGRFHDNPRLYAAPADEDTLLEWGGYGEWGNNPSSSHEGYKNTYPNLAMPKFPAAYACATKPPAGTWFLPSHHELRVIWDNREAIDLVARGFHLSGAIYFASSERNRYYPDARDLTFGAQPNVLKDSSQRVRCVRH